MSLPYKVLHMTFLGGYAAAIQDMTEGKLKDGVDIKELATKRFDQLLAEVKEKARGN